VSLDALVSRIAAGKEAENELALSLIRPKRQYAPVSYNPHLPARLPS
jgi:hypothetical protein